MKRSGEDSSIPTSRESLGRVSLFSITNPQKMISQRRSIKSWCNITGINMPRNGASWQRCCTKKLDQAARTRIASTIITLLNGARSIKAKLKVDEVDHGGEVEVQGVAVELLLIWNATIFRAMMVSHRHSQRQVDRGGRQHQRLVQRLIQIRRPQRQLQDGFPANLMPMGPRKKSFDVEKPGKRKEDGKLKPILLPLRLLDPPSNLIVGHQESRWRTKQASACWETCLSQCSPVLGKSRWCCQGILN